VVQCVAVRCSSGSAESGNTMLQCVVVCCSALWCVAVCCSVLQCVAAIDAPGRGSLRRDVLQCIGVCCLLVDALGTPRASS